MFADEPEFSKFTVCVGPPMSIVLLMVQQCSFLGVHRPLAPYRHVVPYLLPKPGRGFKVGGRSLACFLVFLLILSFSEACWAAQPSPSVLPQAYSPLLFPQVTHRLGERGQLSRADFFHLNQNHLQGRSHNWIFVLFQTVYRRERILLVHSRKEKSRSSLVLMWQMIFLSPVLVSV